MAVFAPDPFRGVFPPGSPGNPFGGKVPPVGGSNTQVISNPLVVSSGLYDVTQPKYPIRFQPGTPNRLYRYVGPLVLLTDLFSGTLLLSSRAGTFAPATVTISLTHSTLDQWAAQINALFNAHATAKVVKLGTTGYLTIESIDTAVSNASLDTVLTMTPTITDDNDPYLSFDFVPLIANGFGLQGAGTWKWAVGFRDPATGHLSNMSPVATISNLPFASEVNLTINTHSTPSYQSQGLVMEVYRTAMDGSSLLFVGVASLFTGGTYGFRDTFPDNFLNPSLVGPINEQNDPPVQGLFGLVQHSGRLWGIKANRVYYSGGPDTTNGNGYEAWPPSNYFEYHGDVIKILSSAQGLVVFLKDDVHLISGVDTSSFYSDPWLIGFGILNPHAALYDGQTLYVYTTKQQMHAISPSQQKEIGFDVGDILAAHFPSATSNLTMHRGTSLDMALYLSNGIDSIFRYDPRQRSWSPLSKPVMGVGRVKSVETGIGINQLWIGTPPAATPASIFTRDLTIWQDNGTPYPAFATIGTILAAEPGAAPATFDHVALQVLPRGTMPTIWVLNNELDPTVVPFVQLNNPVPDPTNLPPAKTLWSRRWYLKSANVMLPMLIQTTQVKISFPAENAKNEVLGVYLRGQP